MIGRLVGELIESQPPLILMDVGGVGYELSAPMSTFYALPELGGKITLYTHLVVREDAQALYGFASSREKSLFQILIKANGVGPKLALAIMSGIDTDEFVSCIHAGDSAALVRIPGIGKKTAERLVIDLGDRLKEWRYSVSPVDMTASAPSTASNKHDEAPERGETAAQPDRYQMRKDAESALMSLGYKPNDAEKAVGRALKASEELGEAVSREVLIRLALQSMVKKTVAV